MVSEASKLYNYLFFADMSTALVATFLIKVVTVQAWSNIPSEVPLKPYSSPPDPSEPANNEELDFMPCFSIDIPKDPDKGHLNTFSTTGALQCWLYCKSNFKCFSLSFEILSSTCSLFDGDSIMSNREVEKGFSITLEKHCMEMSKKTSLGASITDIIYLSISGVGFLIEQALYQITCLTKGKSLRTKPEDDVSYRLKWKPCKEGSKWVLKDPVRQDLEVEGVDLYQISPADELDLCLEVLVAEDGLKMAILSTCRSLLPEEEDPQLFFVRIEQTIIDQDLHSIFSRPGSEKFFDILFTGKDFNYLANSLFGISFREPSFYEQEGKSSCPLSQFSTPHGVMRNKENVPFVLPGSQVEIQCDQGYGVKNRNYTPTQTLVCSEDAKPQLCTKSSRVRNKENGKEDLCHFFLTVGIVSTIIAVMLLVMLLKKKGQQKKTDTEDLGKVEESKTAV